MAKKKQSKRKTKAVVKTRQVIPKLLYEGQTAYVAGKISGGVFWIEPRKFLKSQGAKLVRKISPDLDMFVQGSYAGEAARKQVDDLNAAGAGIKIISSKSEFWNFPQPDHADAFRDPVQVMRWLSLPSWLTESFELRQEHFEGIIVPRDSNGLVSVERMDNCVAVDCKFNHVWWRAISNSTFSSCEFPDAKVTGEDCEFDGMAGSGVRLELKRSQVRNALLSIDELEGASDCLFSDCQFERMVFWSRRSSNKNSRFIRTRFNNIDSKIRTRRAPTTIFENCVFEDSSFCEGHWGAMEFINCRFKNFSFRNGQFDILGFTSCRLDCCTMENLSGTVLDVSDSKLKKCSVIQNRIEVLVAGKGQKQLFETGTQRITVGDLSKYLHLRELADFLVETRAVELNIVGQTASGKRSHLKIERKWRGIEFRLAHPTKSTQWDMDFDFSLSPIPQLLWQLLRAFVDAEFEDFDIVTTEYQASKKGQVAPFTFCIGALLEVIQQAEPNAASIKAKAEVVRRQITSLRKNIKADLVAGRKKAINQRTILEKTIAQPCRKMMLVGVNLSAVHLQGFDMQNSDFSGANLQSAKLSEARLAKSDLTKANLKHAKLNGAHLGKAILTKADCTKANFEGANLTNSVLRGTNLEEANLKKADIRFADLSKANLKGANLFMARCNAHTILPKKLPRTLLSMLDWVGPGRPQHQ